MNDKDFTLAYKTFEDDLRKLINGVELPMVVKLMAIREAERAVMAHINKMLEEDNSDVRSN